MPVEFLDAAKSEFLQAVEQYELIRRNLGHEFQREVEIAIERILHFPEAAATITPGYRQQRLKRFPYGVIYRLVKDQIQVVAIAHLSRRPGYWTSRVN